MVDLAISALVDEFANRLEVWLAIGDIGFDESEHLFGSLRYLNEDAVVDLAEAEELKDLLGFGREFVDTTRKAVVRPI